MEYIALDAHKRYSFVSVEGVDGVKRTDVRIEHGPGAIRQFLDKLDRILVPPFYALPLIAGLDGVWIAQPVSDALSFVRTVIFLIREMRLLSRIDKSV